MFLKSKLINWFWLHGRDNMRIAGIFFMIAMLVHLSKPSNITAVACIITGLYFLIFVIVALIAMITNDIRHFIDRKKRG